MPIISTLGALTYPKISGTKAGNAWIAVQTGYNNIQPGPVATLISTSTDIDITSNGTVIFGTASDTWREGRVNQIDVDGNIITGINLSLAASNTVAFAAGIIDSSSNNFYSCGQQSIVVGANFDQRIWVSAVDSTGTILWRNTYYYDATVPTSDWSNGIKIDDSGYLYVVGTYGYNTIQKCFVMKLDNTGAIIWSKNFYQGSGTNRVLGFDIDSSNNLYIIAKSDTSNYIIKINSSGNFITSGTFDSGIASGIYCKGTSVYVAIDTGFIIFDNSLSILNQYILNVGGSDTGLDNYSKQTRKIVVDDSDNIYIGFPRVVGGRHYLYLASFDNSFNLRFCNRIITTRQNLYNTLSTSPTISGIKYYNDRMHIVFRILVGGVNYMYVARLPSDGFVPLNGKYKVDNTGFLYNKINTTVSTASYTISGGPGLANLTLTSNTNGGGTIGAAGYSPITNI